MTDEERDQFDGSIGMHASAEDKARDALRRHQLEQGIVFDDPDAPVTPQPGTRDENFG